MRELPNFPEIAEEEEALFPRAVNKCCCCCMVTAYLQIFFLQAQQCILLLVKL